MLKLKKSQLLRFNLRKIKNKRILVRVDFNVPLEKGKILEKFRIESTKKTLSFLKPAKKIILISHFGDPIKKDNKFSLKKILPQIEKILDLKIHFMKDIQESNQEKINILENLRFWPGEKNCDLNFAKELAKLGEVFVNEAFSVYHRKHASIYLLPKLLPTLYGLNFEREINLLNKVLMSKNITLILGGAKISTKLPLIKKFIPKAKLIILAGGLANTYLKAQGFEVGKSLIEYSLLKEVKKIKSDKIFIPPKFVNQYLKEKLFSEIGKNDIIYDIGKKSLKIIFNLIKNSKTIVWNGPLGYVENKKFKYGTLIFARHLTKIKKTFILVGGGDTLAFLEKNNLLRKFKNISTGGGAMLDYLAN